MNILIRFNTDYPNGKKWRLLMDGEQKLVDEVQIKCQCHTSSDKMPDGVIKHHICCVARRVEYEQRDIELIAIIH